MTTTVVFLQKYPVVFERLHFSSEHVHNKLHFVQCCVATCKSFIFYIAVIAISERELKFTFAICHRPSVCLSSVCRLSSVVCL